MPVKLTKLRGIIEKISFNQIAGWAYVENIAPSSDYEIYVKIQGRKCYASEKFITRPDITNRACGFVIKQFYNSQDLNAASFIDAYEGVFVEWQENGVTCVDELPIYKTALLHFNASASPQISERSRKVAILIRTHLETAKCLNLLQKLSSIKQFDLYICADCTARDIRIGHYAHLSHSVRQLTALGLKLADLPNALYFYGDLPFYSAMFDLPHYDLFLMIEYDVDFSESGLLWLSDCVNKLENNDVDLFAPNISPAHPQWHWAKHAEELLGCGDIFMCNFPIVALSKSAISYLYSQRLIQSSVLNKNRLEGGMTSLANGFPYCEYFVPTALRRQREYKICSAVDIGLSWDAAISEDFKVNLPLLFGKHEPELSAVSHPVLDSKQYADKLRSVMSIAKSFNNRERQILKTQLMGSEIINADTSVKRFFEQL